jgi:hypothetical protein
MGKLKNRRFLWQNQLGGYYNFDGFGPQSACRGFFTENL